MLARRAGTMQWNIVMISRLALYFIAQITSDRVGRDNKMWMTLLFWARVVVYFVS
jgi:hypothetical protein